MIGPEPRSPIEPLPEFEDTRLFRQQESTLVALNLAVLSALVLVHLAFSGMLGVPNRGVLLAIAAFFLAQTVEFVVLQDRRTTFGSRLIAVYPRVSVALKLLAAAWIAVMGGVEDSHYAVLLVLPIMSAAFRFSLAGLLLVATAAAGLTFLQLWQYYRAHPPSEPHEYYEAATVALIYFVVGVIVSNLAGQLRRDRRSLQVHLEELERTKDHLVSEEKLAAVGRLAGAIAHEIRNPVAMIVSSAERLRSPRAASGEREEMLEILVGEARRLENLTTDFLLYARNKPPEPRDTTLAELLDYLAGLARARAEEGGITVRTSGDQAGLIRVDPFQIQQALLNLLMNALHAAPPGTCVTLGARRGSGNDLVLFVENAGPPIPPTTAERLFEPFFTTREKGTGLGLAIARNIAMSHGGDLVLGHNEDGRVRFDLCLPGAWTTSPEPGGS